MPEIFGAKFRRLLVVVQRMRTGVHHETIVLHIVKKTDSYCDEVLFVTDILEIWKAGFPPAIDSYFTMGTARRNHLKIEGTLNSAAF